MGMCGCLPPLMRAGFLAFELVHGFAACGMGIAQNLRLLLRPEAFLIAVGDDVGDDQNEDDEVEARLTHGINREAEDFEMRQMRAFRDKKHADEEQDEKAQDLIHTVLFQEGRHAVRQQNHGETREQNRNDHERHLVSLCRLAIDSAQGWG